MTSEVSLTPDGRYIIVPSRSGPRLWRATRPDLTEDERAELTKQLMDARRAVKSAKTDRAALAVARAAVHSAKVALGERGPVWWDDGAPDYNRTLLKNSPYR